MDHMSQNRLEQSGDLRKEGRRGVNTLPCSCRTSFLSKLSGKPETAEPTEEAHGDSGAGGRWCESGKANTDPCLASDSPATPEHPVICPRNLGAYTVLYHLRPTTPQSGSDKRGWWVCTRYHTLSKCSSIELILNWRLAPPTISHMGREHSKAVPNTFRI